MTDLGAIDIQQQLPHANWQIGTRRATTSITWHYNGPPVAAERQSGAGLLEQLKGDAKWQMRAGWGGTLAGAPGLMYHLVVAADGQVYQTAPISAILWHCAHQDGNSRGLAVHLPLGGAQAPTPVQLAKLIALTEALRARYRIPLDRVLGHLEWRHLTACPGEVLMSHLRDYRAHSVPTVAPTPTPAGLRRWKVRADLQLPARVRVSPSTEGLITGRFKPGSELYIDREVFGGSVDGNRTWLRLAYVPNEQAALGYISATLGNWI